MAFPLEALRRAIRDALPGIANDLEGHSFWRHQRAAVGAIVDHLSDPARDPRASVVIPTGGGKTAVFGALVNAVAARRWWGKPAPAVVMLVPNLLLIGQVLMDFRTRHPDVDIGYLASRTVVDRSGHAYVPAHRPTTVMTYALFMRMVSTGELTRDDVDLIVMDEAHRGLSDMRRGVFTDLFPDTVVIALSATPEFDEERSLNALIGKRNLVFTADPQALRDEGILAPVANYVLAVRIEGGLPDEFEIRQAVRRKAHVDETLSFLETLVDPETGIRPIDKVTLFYGTDRAHASMFAREYNARFEGQGKQMAFLTGEDPAERVQRVVAAIERGEITGIANAQLLAEGFDLAKVGLVVNSPTGSIVRVIQQSGRAQRIDRALALDDVGQTAFVLDTYMEVDGVIEGKPRWYFEALDEVAKAYSVIGPAVRAVDVDVTAYLPPSIAPTATTAAAGTAGGGAAGASASGKAAKIAGSPTRTYVTSRSVAAIRYLLRRRSLGRVTDDKTEEWLARSEFLGAQAMGQTNEFFEDVEREFFEKRQSLSLDASPVVRSYSSDGRTSPPVALRMALMRSGAKPTVCYHASCVPDLIRICGAPMPGRPLGEGWITRKDMIDAVGAAWAEANELFRRTYEAFLTEERLDPDATGVTVDGAFVRMRRIEGARTWVAYHADDIPLARAILGIGHARRQGGEMARAEIAGRLGIPVSDKTFRQALETLRAQADAGEPTQVNGIPVPAVVRYVGGRLAIHLVGDAAVEALSRAIGAQALPRRNDRWAYTADLPQREEGWLSRDDAYRVLRTTYRPGTPLADLWERLCDADEIDGFRTVEGEAFRFRLFGAHNRAVICIHPDDLERFRAMAADPAARVPLDRLDDADLQEGWYTLNKAGPLIGITATTPSLLNAWRELSDLLRDNGEVVVDGERIDMRMMLVRGSLRPCLDDDGLDWIAKRLGRPRDGLTRRTDDELGRADAALALRMKPGSERFREAWLRLERDLEAGADLGGIEARLTRPYRALVIKASSLDAFTAYSGFRAVPADHLDPAEVHDRLRQDLGPIGIERFRGLWLKLEREQSSHDPSYRLERFISGRRTGWAMREADYPRFLAGLRPPEKPAPEPVAPEEDWSQDWATLDEVIVATRALPNGAMARSLMQAILDRQLEIGPVPPGHVTGMGWNDVRIPLRAIPARTRVRFALARLAIPALVPHLAPPAADDDDWKAIGAFAGVANAVHGRSLLDGIRREVEAIHPAASDIQIRRIPVLVDGDDRSEPVDVEPVPVELRVGIRKTRTVASVQVHRDSWEDLARLTGQNLPTRPAAPGYVSREEAFSRLGITYNARVDDVFRRASVIHAAVLRLTGEDRPVTIEGVTLNPMRVPRGKGAATYFHEDDIDPVAALAGYGPEKPDGWLDRKETAAACRVNERVNPVFSPFWDGLAAQAARGEPVVLEGRTLRVATFRKGPAKPVCLHRDDVAHVIEALGFVTVEKSDAWIDKLSAAAALRTAMTNPRFAAAWDGLIADREGRSPPRLDGRDVAFRKVINGSRTPYCIHRDDIPALAAAVGIERPSRPLKTPDWVTEHEFCDAHRTNQQHQPVVNPLWASFREAALSGDEVRLATGTPRVAILRNGAHDVACIHSGDLPMLRRHLGISPPIDAEETARDWRPRGAVMAAAAEADQDWLAEAWDDLSLTLVADPDSAPEGVRLRVDIAGAGVIMRVHREDVGAMAAWALREARTNERAFG